MRISVKFFGSFRQRFSREAVLLNVPEGSQLGDVLAPLAERFPDLARLGYQPLMAINDAFEKPDKLLSDGDRVNLFPPVHGGRADR